MSHITTRTCKDENDIQIAIDLIARVRSSSYGDDYPNKVDIEESLASPEIRANTRLWFDEDQSIGWAYVDEFRNLWWDIDSHYEELISAQIVEWGETCVQKTVSKAEVSTLDTSCREDNTPRLSFLAKYGFQRVDATTVYMTRPLSEPIPEPTLPQGFMLRSVTGLEEAEAIANTHRVAFGTEYMTTERRLAIMSTSEYDPSLDLVVLAPDGSVAAYCTCSVNSQKRIGTTDPIATHPSYQRLGLARALLLQGMRLLKARGMSSARLGTSGDNLAMQKTAESVGFSVEYRNLWFSKEIT